ncbi:hypothetical protein [Cochlodiniinecator piscidefendens]|uniref:hypothetical protein n=1 Tax=Cochlodiniinecator piscidefendens TaxID=2715756 RepID=UPI001E3E2A27|nr:hypothetical protein [Cochlodiniinecator piscidefendens]
MKTPVASLLVAAMFVTSCGTIRESRLNPFNWFGRSQQEETVAVDDAAIRAPSDPRPLVTNIVSLHIDQTPGGAIIRAVGLPPTQGYFGAALVPENDERPVDGVLTYSFRIIPPEDFQLTSTQVSREVVVGQFISDASLQGVRQIRVVAAENARSSRR